MSTDGINRDRPKYHPVDLARVEESAQLGLDALRAMDETERKELTDQLPGHMDAIAQTVSALDHHLLDRDEDQLFALAGGRGGAPKIPLDPAQVEAQIGGHLIDDLDAAASLVGDLIDALRIDDANRATDPVKLGASGRNVMQALIDIGATAGLSPAHFSGIMSRLAIAAGIRDQKTFAMAGVQQKIDRSSVGQELAQHIFEPLRDKLIHGTEGQHFPTG